MAKRIPVETITVLRDGKRVTPQIGVPFEFTAAEIHEIEGTKTHPGIRPQAWTKVTREDDDATSLEVARGAGPRDDSVIEEKPPTGAKANLAAVAKPAAAPAAESETVAEDADEKPAPKAKPKPAADEEL